MKTVSTWALNLPRQKPSGHRPETHRLRAFNGSLRSVLEGVLKYMNNCSNMRHAPLQSSGQKVPSSSISIAEYFTGRKPAQARESVAQDHRPAFFKTNLTHQY